MARFSVSAVGVDRPGIVAGLSGALAERGCNLEDSTMAVLQGHFAVLLVVAAPDGVGPGELEAALAGPGRSLGLDVAVRPLGAGAAPPEGEAWVLAVHGADRPGIVHAVTAALAEAGGNVIDLGTHLVEGGDGPVYVLTLRATLPAGDAGRRAAAAVEAAAASVGVRCSLHRDDADVL